MVCLSLAADTGTIRSGAMIAGKRPTRTVEFWINWHLSGNPIWFRYFVCIDGKWDHKEEWEVNKNQLSNQRTELKFWQIQKRRRRDLDKYRVRCFALSLLVVLEFERNRAINIAEILVHSHRESSWGEMQFYVHRVKVRYMFQICKLYLIFRTV